MSNGTFGLFLGRSDEEQRALRRLIDGEDRIFRLQPNEETSLREHARADVARFQLINARMKLSEATSERKSDRNFYATVILGLAIFVKSGVAWTDIFHFFASL